MSEGKNTQDFIQCLGRDMSIDVFNHLNLNDPCDLIRASAVSKSWYQFVVKNGLCKKRCFKLLPELIDVVDSIEVDNIIEPVSDMDGVCADWECLKRNHKVYAALAFHLARYVKNGITSKIEASYSLNELGDVLESLTYRLCSNICLITKIRVQPYQAFCEDDSPMYTYSTVRFRIGRVKTPSAWTYTSPHYSILQEKPWQELELPEPGLCNGGTWVLWGVEVPHRVVWDAQLSI
ncbi:F-box protein At4g00755-like [Medicago truncatula]|uniref:F-box protein At4g00755-like n=1 Tax=Medicago truncatula TaxID=3880 RepID=UPI0019682E34|nr:F-box protein At4g00755-like [Medicago truncatula]